MGGLRCAVLLDGRVIDSRSYGIVLGWGCKFGYRKAMGLGYRSWSESGAR
jgi:hypothetical protein